MSSLTVGLFGGDPESIRLLGSALGKKGTESDLRFWNKKERDVAVTAITAIGYPERITPMLQVASMCDVPVLLADRLDAGFGEQVLALAAVRKRGFVILSETEDADRANALAKERLRAWVTLKWSGESDVRRLRELLLDVRVERDLTSSCTIVIDHAFNVRGVGTVALGFVRRGTLRVHDELRLLPPEKSVGVRSIQRFDEEQDEARAGSRVGVALRGVEADEIDRGAVLTGDPRVAAGADVVLESFEKVEFAKDPVAPGARGFHLTAGLFTRPVVLAEVGARSRFVADRPIPVIPGEFAFLTVLRGPGTLRVLGTGMVAG